VLFQELVGIPESIPAQCFRAALPQSLDAVAEPPRGRRQVLQATVGHCGGGLHPDGVADVELVLGAAWPGVLVVGNGGRRILWNVLLLEESDS
jgi:hypothetical protein